MCPISDQVKITLCFLGRGKGFLGPSFGFTLWSLLSLFTPFFPQQRGDMPLYFLFETHVMDFVISVWYQYF